jgi:hypothetical protein
MSKVFPSTTNFRFSMSTLVSPSLVLTSRSSVSFCVSVLCFSFALRAHADCVLFPGADCNSTGVYSGTTNSGNGNTADTSVLNKTWLRGVQPTDEEGVASFDTIFPGHYTGRATHIHTLLHRNATVRDNGTVFDTSFSHIGQTFWDQTVRDAVELLSPYNTNTQTVTSNADDRVLQGEAATSDPVFRYVQLGDDIQDGFLAWIVLSVNTTLSNTVSPAAILYESGGVEEA